MQNSYRQVFHQTKEITSPATFKKAIVAQINRESATVDVTIVGNNQTVLKSLPISSAVTLDDLRIGDRCRVDMFDETNPQDAVIAYTYGRGRRPVYNVNASAENIGVEQARLDVTGTGLFFNGKSVAGVINSGSTMLDQAILNVIPTGKFFSGLTVAGTINIGTELILANHISGILTGVTGVTVTNPLMTFLATSITFLRPLLNGGIGNQNMGTTGSRFGTGFFTAVNSNSYIASGATGVNGSFKSGDLVQKTITVTRGIITSIT